MSQNSEKLKEFQDNCEACRPSWILVAALLVTDHA